MGLSAAVFPRQEGVAHSADRRSGDGSGVVFTTEPAGVGRRVRNNPPMLPAPGGPNAAAARPPPPRQHRQRAPTARINTASADQLPRFGVGVTEVAELSRAPGSGRPTGCWRLATPDRRMRPLWIISNDRTGLPGLGTTSFRRGHHPAAARFSAGCIVIRRRCSDAAGPGFPGVGTDPTRVRGDRPAPASARLPAQ